MLISESNRNTVAIIELRLVSQKTHEIRGVSTVTFGNKNEGTPVATTIGRGIHVGPSTP